MQHCPYCGAGELKIIATILERPVMQKILTHLGLDPQPPPKAGAREPGPRISALSGLWTYTTRWDTITACTTLTPQPEQRR
jgi:hypothetical protein